MKESRLFKIVYYLLDKGRATTPELAQEFEVSVRTIYRDIDALSESGIPVYAETGRNGGIYLLDNYVLDKALLSDKEKLEILSSLQSLSATGSLYDAEVLTKLSALFKISSENWFEVDFSRWGSKAKDNAKFESLKSAVIHHNTLAIVYVNARGIKSKRNINPLKLMYKSKEWYLKAYCTDKEDFRLFKFNRIIELEVTDNVFLPMDYPDSQDVPAPSCHKIVLRFPKEMAYRVYDEFDAEEIQVLPSYELIVTSEMPLDSWLVGYLLSFGAQVQVMEPACLHEILAEQAMKIYETNRV